MVSAEDLVIKVREAFNTNKTKSKQFRIKQLNGLLKLYEENEQEILDALTEDLRKPTMEAVLAEIDYLKNDVRGYLLNLDEYMKEEYPSKSLPNIMDSVVIQSEPYGVVLIIGAWNYPVQLCLAPLAGAIAAGNCAILKPSEVAVSSAKLLARLLPKYLDTDCFPVFNGGIPETTDLLKQRFDYIFYTGSPQVGKIVYNAAAQHLTPVTLELGGKSPVYVDEGVDLDIAASRILWGKCLNVGQTCIAPDYMLCTEETKDKFVQLVQSKIEQFYGPKVKQSPDYGRIINDSHMKRLVQLLEKQNVVYGGDYDLQERYFAPTIITNCNKNDPIMQQEIFGPILPIYTIKNAKEALDFINSREKPLALYVFSTNQTTIKLFQQNTSSGNFLANDTVMHFSCDSLPFGGVGNSGIGRYHGKYGFDTFSHKKGALLRSLNKIGEMMQNLRYPPYTSQKLASIIQATKKRGPIPGLKHAKTGFVFVLGLVTAICLNYVGLFGKTHRNK